MYFSVYYSLLDHMRNEDIAEKTDMDPIKKKLA